MGVRSGGNARRAGAPSVGAICRHLDGIPLAIELAAARVCGAGAGNASCRDRARLHERFRLLSGGSRRSQERHRTLLATVGWSHDLLSAEEKTVFRRLAVFPASFDLAAAEAIAQEDAVDVVACVLRLVDRSLVQYETQTGRYRLLETLRQYAADRLVDAGETDAVRARHGKHFASVVESLAPQLIDARYSGASAKLAADMDNLRGLAEWCIDGGRWGVLANACLRMWVFLLSEHPVDVAAWHQAVIGRGEEIDPQVLVDVMGQLAYITVNSLADFPAALALADRSIHVADEQGLKRSPSAWYARTQAIIYSTRGPESRLACQQAFADAEERRDEFIAICAQATLEYLDVDESGRVASIDAALEAVRRAERTGHPVFITTAVVIAASMYISTTSPLDFAACAAMLRGTGGLTTADDAIAMWLDLHLGAALAGLGNVAAVVHLARAFRLSDRQKSPHAKDWSLRLLAVAAAGAGHLAEAAFLVGYTEAHLRAHRILNSNHKWISATLDELLPTTDERVAHERARAMASRRDIFNVIERLEAASASP